MATTPQTTDPTLDIREQAARIDQMLADIDQKLATALKVKQETRFAPITLIFTGMGAAAAFFAAGAAFTKLLLG